MKKKRARLSADAVELLRAEFEIEPYPDAGRISEIAEDSGLEVKQVANWFARQRSTAGEVKKKVTQRASGYIKLI